MRKNTISSGSFNRTALWESNGGKDNEKVQGVTKTVKKFCCVCMMLALFSCSGTAQEMTLQNQQPDLPNFHLDALRYASNQPEAGRLDLYLQMPYEMLSFTKEGDVFKASYEVTVVVTDSAGKVVEEKTWVETITTKNYTESISNHLGKTTQKTFLLRAASYKLSVQAEDLETKKIARTERTIVVKDFNIVEFGTSDVMLVNRLSAEGDKKIIVPNVSGSIWDITEKFYLYFEIYDRSPADSAQFLMQVLNSKGEIVQKDSVVQPLRKQTTSCFLTVNCAKLSAGEYKIEIQGTLLGTKGAALPPGQLTLTKSFILRWRAMPVSFNDLDLAIDQLQYATDKETIEEMKNLAPEQKRERFLAFWKKRDPTPATEQNELMEEYYRRVDYANKNFTVYMDGWKTDRGMVYIIFGPPSNVDRHPFDSDAKPYEVWTYYELNREFVFIDQTGFGDYRLQNPIWDMWRTRYR